MRRVLNPLKRRAILLLFMDGASVVAIAVAFNLPQVDVEAVLRDAMGPDRSFR